MLSVFEKVFKRPKRQPAEGCLSEANQAPFANTAQNEPPNSEITATEIASSISNDLSGDIVFIDGAVENISHLLRELDPAADLYVLHLQSDGLEQISDYLLGRENLVAVHLFCNGGPDFLNLGSAKIMKDSLSRAQLASLMRIGAALGEQSDFLIYGCELGTNEAGADMISNMSEIIGADIAVSPHATGRKNSPTEPVVENTVLATATKQDESIDPAIIGKTNGSNGTVIFDLNGNITYVADPGFYGVDVFEYKVGAGETIEQVKVHVNIVPEDKTMNVEAVSHFNVVSETQLTSVTSNHGLSLVEGELSLGENGKLEFAHVAPDSEISTISVNLQKCSGEGSPSFKIAVAPSNFVPSIEIAEPIEAAVHQEVPDIEATEVVVEAAQEVTPETVEQITEPEVSEAEVVEENFSDAAAIAPIQFEDFSGGSLSFPFDPQLQEPELTGNSMVGQLIVDSYVRPGTLFLDVNNSFDPRRQGVVSHYLIKQADGSPLPENVQLIRDGFFTVDQKTNGGELDLLIEAELQDGHIVSRALRVDVLTGSLEALSGNETANKSSSVEQAAISTKDGSQRHTSATNNH